MEVRPGGSVPTDVRPVHSKKAASPRDVTLVANEILVSPTQPVKAELAIEAVPATITAFGAHDAQSMQAVFVVPSTKLRLTLSRQGSKDYLDSPLTDAVHPAGQGSHKHHGSLYVTRPH